jgi:hypothetical protein
MRRAAALFYPGPALARPGANQVVITLLHHTLMKRNWPPGRPFRHHDRETFFFFSIAKYRQSRNYFTTVSISRRQTRRFLQSVFELMKLDLCANIVWSDLESGEISSLLRLFA